MSTNAAGNTTKLQENKVQVYHGQDIHSLVYDNIIVAELVIDNIEETVEAYVSVIAEDGEWQMLCNTDTGISAYIDAHRIERTLRDIILYFINMIDMPDVTYADLLNADYYDLRSMDRYLYNLT